MLHHIFHFEADDIVFESEDTDTDDSDLSVTEKSRRRIIREKKKDNNPTEEIKVDGQDNEIVDMLDPLDLEFKIKTSKILNIGCGNSTMCE